MKLGFVIKTVLIAVVVVQIANLALAFYWFQGLTAVKAPEAGASTDQASVYVFDVPPDVQVPQPKNPVSAPQAETPESENSGEPLKLVRENLDFASALAGEVCILQIGLSGMAGPKEFPLVEREWHIVEACEADLLDLYLSPELNLNFDPPTGNLIFNEQGLRAKYETARSEILDRLIQALKVLDESSKPELGDETEETEPKKGG